MQKKKKKKKKNIEDDRTPDLFSDSTKLDLVSLCYSTLFSSFLVLKS